MHGSILVIGSEITAEQYASVRSDLFYGGVKAKILRAEIGEDTVTIAGQLFAADRDEEPDYETQRLAALMAVALKQKGPIASVIMPDKIWISWKSGFEIVPWTFASQLETDHPAAEWHVARNKVVLERV